MKATCVMAAVCFNQMPAFGCHEKGLGPRGCCCHLAGARAACLQTAAPSLWLTYDP